MPTSSPHDPDAVAPASCTKAPHTAAVSGSAALFDLAATICTFSVTMTVVLALAGALCAGLMLSARQFQLASRSSRQAVRSSPLHAMSDRLRAIAKDAKSTDQHARLLREVDAASQQLNIQKLMELRPQLQRVIDQYRSNYEVRIVDNNAEERGFFRDQTDDEGNPFRAYYLIVESRNSAGNLVPRVTNSDDATNGVPVARWAERVPREVYDRILAGRDQSTLFAVKENGQYLEEIRMEHADGTMLPRLEQLTEW